MDNTLTQGATLQGKAYRYRIERVLGQGTFGITYLARVELAGALGTLDSEMRVAIKEFFMRDINGRSGEETVTSGSNGGIYEDYKRKFAREAHNLSRLHHPHIVKVLEAFEANNTVYYAMEYCGGGSLDDLIARRGGLPEAEALRLFQQVASALDFMHAHKMLHLDVKPANVMLRANGEAVLIDFGLSKQYTEGGEPESSTTVGGGTPGYAPIEQANYRQGRDFPVTMDVYALGATLFKMLTGARPPEASAILNVGFPAYELQKKRVSDNTIACVSKAMNPLVAQRYPSVAAFADGLRGEVRPPKPPKPPKPPVPPEPPKPFPWKVVAALAGVVAIALVVYFATRPGQSATPSLQALTEQVSEQLTAQFADSAAAETDVPVSAVPEESREENHPVRDASGKLLFHYTGDMLDGQPEGRGTALYPDGRKYEGPFVRGKREGSGATFTFSDGNVYEGSFRDDHLDSGVLTSKQKDTYGTYFKGTFRDDKPHTGTWYDSKGGVISRITNGK